jgi:hypothetical protein
MAITQAPGEPKFKNQKPFVPQLTKESLCTIRLFFLPPITKMLSSPAVSKILKFCYHDIVAMTHTHLSMVSK